MAEMLSLKNGLTLPHLTCTIFNSVFTILSLYLFILFIWDMKQTLCLNSVMLISFKYVKEDVTNTVNDDNHSRSEFFLQRPYILIWIYLVPDPW